MKKQLTKVARFDRDSMNNYFNNNIMVPPTKKKTTTKKKKKTNVYTLSIMNRVSMNIS